MKWTKVNNQWQCVFANVPLKVLLVDKVEFIKATLYFNDHDFWIREIATKTYASVELAKAEVEAFILEHLALYSAQVHRECLEANTMTWRKLLEDLKTLPEHQLDNPVRILDTDNCWVDTLKINIADESLYRHISTGENLPVSKSEHVEEDEMVLQVFEEEPYIKLIL